ncbi:MAG: TetR/AcrR family transcriptional regulator [Youngiibacter sp.]|nr:TetR/AcrR family transcriptional regulator [Youngiibacter sp.]
MYTNFEKLDESKKERILNAALAEFARNGYRKASTNEIVKEAGISKGILFHYFKDKLNLYRYLYDYAIQTLMDDLYGKLSSGSPDFIERIMEITRAKGQLVLKHPELFRFIETAYLDDADEARSYMDERTALLLKEAQEKMLSGIDMSHFKEGIDIPMAMQIITWTFDGYGKTVFTKAKAEGADIDYQRIFSESEKYLKLLKKMLYKYDGGNWE